MMDAENIHRIVFPRDSLVLQKKELPVFHVEERADVENPIDINEESWRKIQAIDLQKVSGKKGRRNQYYSREDMIGFLNTMGVKMKSNLQKKDIAELLLSELQKYQKLRK